VSIRDREGMTPRHRIAVADGKRQGIRCDNPSAFNGTKGAFRYQKMPPEDTQ
jgi:hypothetical protein